MRGLRSSLILSVVAGLLLLPLPASAMRTTVWSFLNGDVNGNWNVTALNRPVPGQDGLRISTAKDGYMLRSTDDLGHGIDALTFTVTSRSTVEALLLWHPRGAAEGLIGQVPFTIPASDEPRNINVTGSGLPGWDSHADMVGFRLPAGADVTIQGIGLHRWNPYEKAIELVKGFWTLDTESPHSINFLWGPLISTNPVTRESLYAESPPFGYSAAWIFFAIVGAGIVAAAFLYARRKGAGRDDALRRSLLIVLAVAAACWFTFDLRMSLEYWSYVTNDIRNYAMKPVGERRLRNFDELPDVVERAHALLEGRPTFGLVTDAPVALGIIRYHTYPSLPILADKAPPETTDWLVFRSDAIVDDRGRLSLHGVPLSASGSIIERFDDRSFFFRTYP